jgi:putative inorganic carbon (HCO3(-)) transporter
MPGYSWSRRSVASFAMLLLTAGIVFSYTRAAWVGVAAALGVFAVMRLRVPSWVVGGVAVVATALVLGNLEQITLSMERNRTQSNDDMAQHVSSISNISSDASNLERINRWNSALRMFGERPPDGLGTGHLHVPVRAPSKRPVTAPSSAPISGWWAIHTANTWAPWPNRACRAWRW